MIIQQLFKSLDGLPSRDLGLCKIHKFLIEMNNEYSPSLDTKVDLYQYTEKILDNAILFVEGSDSDIVGMVVLYCNDKNGEKAYIPLVGVLPSYQRQGIAKKLMREAISYVKSKGFKTIGIHSNNQVAVKAYCKLGFIIIEPGERKYMELRIK